MFRNKHVPFHPAGGASGQLSRQTPEFGTDRVTLVIDRTYAVLRERVLFASGRAEDSLLFHKNVTLCVTFL